MTDSPKTIYKYEILGMESSLDLPQGAQVLAAQVQGQSVCLWVLVDPSLATERRSFAVYGTGWPLPANAGTFIAIIHLPESGLVWHVFESDKTI